MGSGRGRRGGCGFSSYEVKNKSEKLRCLLLRRKKIVFYDVIVKQIFYKRFSHFLIVDQTSLSLSLSIPPEEGGREERERERGVN
jgi:hypothetical protein